MAHSVPSRESAEIHRLRNAPEATSYQGAVQGQMSHSFDQYLPFNP